jgi:DNA-binding MarR family transcriptional regulator
MDDHPDTRVAFGDLLALARERWVAQMSSGLAERGYLDYRRSDALVLRVLLRRGPAPLNHLADRLGVTRQAARKVVDGLEGRGFVVESRDPHDRRVVNVQLTPPGEEYAAAVVAVVRRLNDELRRDVDPGDLAAARRVLRAVLERHP